MSKMECFGVVRVTQVIFAVLELWLCRTYTWLYTGQFVPLIYLFSYQISR